MEAICCCLLTHFGHWVHIASERGRRRLPRWMPLPELRYAQVVKRRVKRRIVHVSQKVIYGRNVRGRIKQTIGSMINTSFVERMNLTLRHHVPALARRTIQIAKTALGLEQQLSLTGAYYNFCLPHETLKRPLAQPIPTNGNGSPKKWSPCTPMMAEGLTFHVWTLEELLTFRVPPKHLWDVP